MPLTRYQVRNEYSLADPELYQAIDRDDPEALLEGVAMAGLVGVLRQLGDLAEFAAEIFHDLHEEVMATAARGHGLMVRVQQLEAEFSSIEKEFLSQTNHSLFFTNAGVDWHPSLCMEQNLITRGELPRCVMDSYEECRGPPRLFLLDKFDISGAGACLKRYTDPSFFKVEAAPSEIPSVEVQMEKKIRKVKKKGSRKRNNGETPEIVPTSHAKLHQLFLEERIEKGHSDPARLVKLKKRQLNASPFDSRSGQSYMEKFLETTAEQKVVRDISVTPLPLNMTSDNSSEYVLEIHDISAVSPVKRSSRENDSTCSSLDAHEVVPKPCMDEVYGKVIDRQIVKVPEPSADDERDEIHSSLHEVTIEKEIVVDEEGKTEGSVDGDNSDDLTSEVDNYMDALTTMESEMETENEYRLKTGLGFSNVEKRVMDSDRNEEKLEVRAHSSDSLSIGNFSASDDGNSSFKKGRSSFSYSDTLSNLAENIPFDGEGSATVFPSSEASATQITATPSNQLPADVRLMRTKSSDFVLPNEMSIDEDKNCDPGEEYSNSSHTDSNPPLLAFDPAETSLHHKLDKTLSGTMKPSSELTRIYAPAEVDATEGDDAPFELPSNCPNSSVLEDHAGYDDFINEGVQVENMAYVDDDINTVVRPSPDIICSPSKDFTNLQEFPSASENPQMDGWELHELVSQECLRGSELENKMIQLEVAAKGFDSASSNLVSYDESNLEMVQGVHNLSLAETTQNSLPAGDFTVAAASSELSCQEMDSNCLHHSRFLEEGEDSPSLPTAPFLDVDTSLEQSLRLQADQLDVEFTKGQVSSDSAIHLSEGILCLDDTNQGRLFNDASEYCQQDHLSQPSPSECLQQSAGLGINNSNPKMDPLGSVFPSFGLDAAAQVNLEEMPPLPPLPPMQWRLGKIQHAPQFSPREFFDHGQESCLSIFSFGNEKDQSSFLSQQRGILQPVNPFLPVNAIEAEKLQQMPQREVDNEMQPTLSSLQFPSLANNANCQKNSLALEQTQSLNLFLTLSALPSEKPEHGFLASEHEEVQLSSNPFLSLPGVEDTSCKHGHVSSPEKLIQHLNELEPEQGLEGKTVQGFPERNSSDTSVLPAGKFEEQPQLVLLSSEAKILQQTPENSQGGHRNPSDTSVLPPGKVEEQPQHCLPSSEGTLQGTSENSEGECGNPSDKSVLPPGRVEEHLRHVLSTSEVGKGNGSSIVKLPRPRNPLIDAVAALDKSKLRKVIEYVRPQIGPKVYERDSLLEQIRTKSFNLKRAVVSRPSIQGPKTNLKVAAILEKANAIRQATAGSDEDDDEDWSDS